MQRDKSKQHGVTELNPGATSSLNVSTKTAVLRQTATATVSNPRNEKLVQARLIFDSGSQRSCISSHLRNALELPSLHSKNFVTNTFGAVSDQPRQCDVVQFCVSKMRRGLNLYVEVYSVPSICAPLSQQKISWQKPHMNTSLHWI